MNYLAEIEDGQLSFDGHGSVRRHFELSNLRLYSTNQNPKTGISLVDCGEYVLRDILIDDYLGSVGIRTFGREHGNFHQIEVQASIPFRISPNPNYATGLSADFLTIDGRALITTDAPQGLPWACLLVDDNCQLTNVDVRNLNLVGGEYGVYWKTAVNPYPGVSYNIRYHNVRWEQPVNPQADFHIDFQTGACEELTISQSTVRKQAFFNNVRHLTLQGNRVWGTAGIVVQGGFCDSISVIGCRNTGGATITIPPHLHPTLNPANTGTHVLPATEFYVR